MSVRVLIGEGDGELRDAMARYLRSRGYHVSTTTDGRRALRMLRREDVHVAIVDLRMRGMSGPKLLAANAAHGEPRPLIAVAPQDDIYAAVAALKGGVYEYLTKPFELQHMEWLVQRASTVPPPSEIASRTLLDGPEGDARTRPLFGFSPAMQRMFHAMRRAAHGATPLLLTGEPGTGKAIVARVLHQLSPRRDGPFVALTPGEDDDDEAMQARLFGGGGGDDDRGLLTEADGGTLYVDEVARLGLGTQATLMRALKQARDQRSAGRAGDPGTRDVRLVATSEFDLAGMAREGTLRSDFYWFLSALTIRVPPLRERRADILPLARWLLARHAAAEGHAARVLSPDALHWLQDYTWPGNVRELESVLVRGATQSTRVVIDRDDLAGPSRRLDARVAAAPDQSFEDLLMHRLRPVVRSFAPGPEGSELYDLVVESAEKAVITLTLQRCRGNQSAAARLLGINRNTLRAKITQFQIPARAIKQGAPRGKRR